jgi:hypothetical protein
MIISVDAGTKAMSNRDMRVVPTDLALSVAIPPRNGLARTSAREKGNEPNRWNQCGSFGVSLVSQRIPLVCDATQQSKHVRGVHVPGLGFKMGSPTA